MRGSPTRSGAALAAGWLLLAVACKDPAAIPDPGVVSIVSVTPTGATLVPGQDLQLVGVARDKSRNPLPEEPLEWSSSDPTVATVSPTGLVSASSPGDVVITASREGASATARLAIDEGRWIGPGGGTVSAFGGAFSLEVPENALAAPAAVRVIRFGAPPLDPTSAGGEFDLRLEAALSLPAALTLQFLPENAPAGVAESALGVRFLTLGTWRPVTGSTSPGSGRVTAPISSPGVYGVGRVPAAAPCTAPEHRQFDFWAGRWDVAPTGSGPGTRQASSFVTIEAGGCAIFEDFRDLDVRGESISLYDPATARWYQTYLDNTGVRLILVGGLLGDAMILTEPGNASRITWSLTGSEVRQLGEASTDAGAGWAPAFDLTYRPR